MQKWCFVIEARDIIKINVYFPDGREHGHFVLHCCGFEANVSKVLIWCYLLNCISIWKKKNTKSVEEKRNIMKAKTNTIYLFFISFHEFICFFKLFFLVASWTMCTTKLLLNFLQLIYSQVKLILRNKFIINLY